MSDQVLQVRGRHKQSCVWGMFIVHTGDPEVAEGAPCPPGQGEQHPSTCTLTPWPRERPPLTAGSSACSEATCAASIMVYKGTMGPSILYGPEKGVMFTTTECHSTTPQKPFRCPVEMDAMKSQSASPVDTRGTKLLGGGSRGRMRGGQRGRWGDQRRLLSPACVAFLVNLSRST